MRFNRLLLVAASAAILTSASSCVAVAVGAGVGYLVSQELTQNETLVMRFEIDIDEVWATAQSLMTDISERPPEVTEFPRKLRSRYLGADVTVDVLANDHMKTDVVVEAREYGARTGRVAKAVLEQLAERLAKRQ